MPSSIAEAIVDKNDLPNDLFTYNHETFYEFIEQQYGFDLAELFRFQAIRNATHLLNTSCDDILSILQLESNDIKVLKNLCCFQVAGDNYQIKLGVKLALKRFIELVHIKQKQQKKKKRSSIQHLHINGTQSQSQSQSQTSTLAGILNEITIETQNELPSLPSIPSNNDTSLTRSRLTTLQKKLNELDHIADIKNRINKWWSSMDSNDSSLNEGTHYVLEINKTLNDTYACILTCKCQNRFKLPFVTPGFFKLSSFYRHVKDKQCIKIPKMNIGQENTIIIDEDSAASQSNSSNRALNPVSKETSANITSKRAHSSSTQTASKTVTSMVKKMRILSTNNTDSS